MWLGLRLPVQLILWASRLLPGTHLPPPLQDLVLPLLITLLIPLLIPLLALPLFCFIAPMVAIGSGPLLGLHTTDRQRST